MLLNPSRFIGACKIAILSLLPLSSWAGPADTAGDSTCYGTTSNGRISGAVQLPYSGENFVVYDMLGHITGRTWVHEDVRAVMLDAFAWLEKEQPDKRYMYAETSLRKGGPMKPHRTHQNGLSVDVMVPVLDASGESAYFPTNPLNLFGYRMEFDSRGRGGDYRIDFEALAALIVTIQKSADARGVKVWRFIFAPDLRGQLYATEYGDYIRNNVTFMKNQAWVRHDEHIHVDFDIPCARM